MFKLIDDKLTKWADSKKLSIYKKHRGEEVRSISIVTTRRNKYQLWIEKHPNYTFKIYVWNYDKLSANYKTSTELFVDTLDIAYEMIAFWEENK